MARKLEFDKHEALYKAMMLFWEKGYEASSMEHLVQAMNINRFSIYNSFGDKKVLLLLALENYRTSVLHKLIEPLQCDQPARQCLNNYFDNMGKQLVSNSGALGCFIQKTGQSNISRDTDVMIVLSSMLEELKAALVLVIEKLLKEGELKGVYSNEQVVGFILSQIQGLILLRQYENNVVTIDEQIEMLKQTVFSW